MMSCVQVGSGDKCGFREISGPKYVLRMVENKQEHATAGKQPASMAGLFHKLGAILLTVVMSTYTL